MKENEELVDVVVILATVTMIFVVLGSYVQYRFSDAFCIIANLRQLLSS